VFDNLIESGRKPEKRKFLGVGFVSLVIHAVLIGAAAYATLGASQADQKVLLDTLNVFLNQQQEQKPPEQQVIMPDVPLKGFQTVVAPDIIPTSIPQINLTEHFDPKDYSGTGVEGGVANGLTPSSDALYTSAIVEEQPAAAAAGRHSRPCDGAGRDRHHRPHREQLHQDFVVAQPGLQSGRGRRAAA